MKKYLYIIILVSACFSCATAPKNFTYRYTGEQTGLDKLIDIEGYYVSQHGCDTSFYSVYMFYPDGLFTIATTSTISEELIACFMQGGNSRLSRYPTWGIYKIEENIIKTQVIRTDGNFVIFRDYSITGDGLLLNVSDFVEPRYSNMGYLKNYPSFTNNPCAKPAVFSPLDSKRNVSECPFINKNWFKNKK